MKRIILSLSIAALISACQTQLPQTSDNTDTNAPNGIKAPSKQSLSDRQRSELYQAILTAELSEGNGDLETALTHYLYALTILPDSEIAAEAIVLAQKTHDPAALIQASKVWLELEPRNENALEANILGQLMQFDQSDDLRAQSLNNAYDRIQTLSTLYSDPTKQFHELAGLSRLYLQGSTLSLWRELIRRDPDSPLGWVLLADAFLRASQVNDKTNFIDEAEQAIEAALRVDDSFVPAINLRIQWLKATGKEQQISTFLETLLLQNPNNEGAYSALSQLYYQNRQFDKAIITANRWQQLNPDNLEAIYIKAASYYGEQNFEQAFEAFEQLLDKDFRPVLSAYYCGDTAERTNRVDRAIECYAMIDSGKYWYPALQRWAFLHLRNNNPEPALEKLESLSTDDDPRKSEQSVVLKADLLMQLNRQLEAIDWLVRFINQDLTYIEIPIKHFHIMHLIQPQTNWTDYANSIANRIPSSLKENWYLQLANELANQDKAEQSIALLNHQLTAEPDNVNYMYSRALLRELTEEYSKMEKELRKLYAMEPDNPNIQNALGYTLADMNKELDFALELIQAAQMKLPRSSAVMDSLGWVYYRKGDFENAEKWLSSSLKIDVSGEVLAHLIEVLVKNKKQDQAELLLKQFWPQVKSDKDIIEVVEQFKLTTP
ncbi:tetratricopeptide repeat protein [Pleionea sediminis]|uniref:tetratricopeptide repeat protein n=1 Tax=Pleionea sediminis TaxID=2569479 RepID=UPI0011861682|nr:CDC27 family protein [Pleionea sediminis]